MLLSSEWALNERGKTATGMAMGARRHSIVEYLKAEGLFPKQVCCKDILLRVIFIKLKFIIKIKIKIIIL